MHLQRDEELTETANSAVVVDSDYAVLNAVDVLFAGAAAGVMEGVVKKTGADGATAGYVLVVDLTVEDDSAGDGMSGFDLDVDFVVDYVVLTVAEMDYTGGDEYSADSAHSGVAV